LSSIIRIDVITSTRIITEDKDTCCPSLVSVSSVVLASRVASENKRKEMYVN